MNVTTSLTSSVSEIEAGKSLSLRLNSPEHLFRSVSTPYVNLSHWPWRYLLPARDSSPRPAAAGQQTIYVNLRTSRCRPLFTYLAVNVLECTRQVTEVSLAKIPSTAKSLCVLFVTPCKFDCERSQGPCKVSGKIRQWRIVLSSCPYMRRGCSKPVTSTVHLLHNTFYRIQKSFF